MTKSKKIKVEFDVDEYIRFVHEKGVIRKKAQGKLDEADYVCGAMAIFFVLKMADKIPAGWIFPILGGAEVFKVDDDDEFKDCIGEHDGRTKKCKACHDKTYCYERTQKQKEWKGKL